MRGRWIVLVGCLAAAAAGCTSPAPPAEPAIVDETRALEPGDLLEVNLEMNDTDEVTADFQAAQPVAWDVHSHEGGEVLLHDEGRAANGTVAFEAPSRGTFSLLWENDDEAPVELAVTVRGQASLASVVP